MLVLNSLIMANQNHLGHFVIEGLQRGCKFESRHELVVVSLSKKTFHSAKYWLVPGTNYKLQASYIIELKFSINYELHVLKKSNSHFPNVAFYSNKTIDLGINIAICSISLLTNYWWNK